MKQEKRNRVYDYIDSNKKIIIFIKYFQHPQMEKKIRKKTETTEKSLRIHNPLLFISVLEGI